MLDIYVKFQYKAYRQWKMYIVDSNSAQPIITNGLYYIIPLYSYLLINTLICIPYLMALGGEKNARHI